MKKIIFTIAFAALFSLMSHAQTTPAATTPAQEKSQKEEVNPDGTVKSGHGHVQINVPESERARPAANTAKTPAAAETTTPKKKEEVAPKPSKTNSSATKEKH